MTRALIITDIQNDFCPGGALPVPHGDTVIPVINGISDRFDKVIAVQDWHPQDHVSFAKTHRRSPFEVMETCGMTQVLWPVHCVQGTFGAAIVKDLNLEHVDLIIRKGTDPRIDDYSAFLENDKKTETGLRYYLQGLAIRDLYICGLALDYCVYFSALDALESGFNVFVVTDASRAIDFPKGSRQRVLTEMADKGVTLVSHEQV